MSSGTGVFFALCIFSALLSSLALSQDASSSQSLADVARKLRKDTTDEVRMTDADTKKLFESVDRIFAFAAEDSGMPKHADGEAQARQQGRRGELCQRRARQRGIHEAVCPRRAEHEEARLPAARFQPARISGEVHGPADCGLLRRRDENYLDAELGSSRSAGTDPGARTHARLAGSELRSAEVDEGCSEVRSKGEKSNETGNDEAQPHARPWSKAKPWWSMWTTCSHPSDAIWWIRPVSSIRWKSLR